MSVSILICTFGGSEWAQLAKRRAYPSASNQGDAAHEIIVLHEPDALLAEVRNLAALKATGDWLLFLDADDELAAGYVVAMRLRSLDVARVYGGAVLLAPAVQYVDVVREVEIAPDEYGTVTKSDDPILLSETPTVKGRPLHEINRCVIGTLVQRELFLHLGGFSADLPIYEDWDLFLRCERAGATIADVPDAVYRAYRRPGSRNEDTAFTQRYYWQIRRAYERKTA